MPSVLKLASLPSNPRPLPRSVSLTSGYAKPMEDTRNRLDCNKKEKTGYFLYFSCFGASGRGYIIFMIPALPESTSFNSPSSYQTGAPWFHFSPCDHASWILVPSLFVSPAIRIMAGYCCFQRAPSSLLGLFTSFLICEMDSSAKFHLLEMPRVISIFMTGLDEF